MLARHAFRMESVSFFVYTLSIGNKEAIHCILASMQAALLTIGDELLIGQVVYTLPVPLFQVFLIVILTNQPLYCAPDFSFLRNDSGRPSCCCSSGRFGME